MLFVPGAFVHQNKGNFGALKKGIRQNRVHREKPERESPQSPRLKTRIYLFEKMLGLWGDKSHLFTNQQLKHTC